MPNRILEAVEVDLRSAHAGDGVEPNRE